MKRKFTSSLFLLLALNMIVKPFWILGVDRTAQNVVGAGEYGLFFALFNFSLLLNILLDFGLTNYNNREISQNSHLLPRFFSNLVVIKLLLAVLYLIACAAIAIAFGYSSRQLWMLGFLVLNQFLSSLILYLRSNVSGLQLFKTDSFLSVTDKVLMILFCSILLWGPMRPHFQIEWFVYVQSISYMATAFVVFIVVYKKSEYFLPKFEPIFFISILRQSYPYALLVLLMSFHYRVDSVMLERMLPDGQIQSGIYAQAFRLLDASTMVPFLFATLLLPIFSRMLRQGDPVKPLLSFAFRLLVGISFSFALACIAFRKEIIDVLYVNNTSESDGIFALLMVSFVFISVSYIIGTLLTANGSLRHLNIIALCAGILNITLNFILIPKYFALGAAVSSLFTQGFIATLQLLLTYRTFGLRFDIKVFLNFLFFVLSSFFIFYISQNIDIQWFIGFVSLFLGGLLLSVIFGIVRVREIFMLYFNPEVKL